MADFDRIFEPHYSATELFTNRVDEYTAFSAALRQHAARVRDGSAALDHAARRNVISFYGVGGIGKTELSRRLESWAVGGLSDPGDWLDDPPSGEAMHAVRFDFHGSRVVNAVDMVLRLRAAVAGRRRRFPAFDLGLAAWWSLARPGTALPDMSAGGFDVRGQITDTLNEALSEAGAGFGVGPLTVRTGIRIVEAVRDNRLRSRTLRRCEPLVHIIDQTQQDASDYVAATLAGLLSWDLDNLPLSKRPVVVAFADAAEYVQDDDRAQERLLNRIVHLTPGILWVVTSRNRLDWDSPHLHRLLPATGPGTWPGLQLETQTDPRQHLVGNLSGTDVERYLHAASGTDGNPLLSRDVIDSIRRGAHGLPLYLSLSLSVARAAHAEPLTADAFGGPLPELATRVFANLPERERELARAASLVPRFDEQLITEAVGGRLGDAHRLCRRTLVTRDQHPLFPCRLHDAVRTAIAHESVTTAGAWHPDDRTAMAGQLLETLRHRSNTLLHDSERRLDVLEIAAALCADHDLKAEWLANALTNLPGFARTAERLPPPTAHTWMGQLSGMFEAWRHGMRGEQQTAYFETFLSSPLRDDIRRLARRRLAYLSRTRGDTERALHLLTELLAETPDSEMLRYQVARTLHIMGRFAELEQHLAAHPLRDPTTELRIRTDLAYDRGLLDEAIVGPATRAAYLRAKGQHRIALENEADALWRRALNNCCTTTDCDAVLEDADRFGETLCMRTALAAKIICQADDSTAATALIADAQSLVRTTGGFQGWRERTSRLVLALRRTDRPAIDQIRRSWLAADTPWTPNQQVLDHFFVFAGYPARYTQPPITSTEDLSEPGRRWHAVITALIDT
ncbi:tetratricopeptide repeat protein [Streptomyces sp. NPDC000345]|uniref:tetratricopeptide repeat protein n=1 Tax=Streptomyces sp. NPDC000345 TaxID=3364537 RepID=UPI0036742A83